MENKTSEQLKEEKRKLEAEFVELNKPYGFKQKLAYILIVATTIQCSISFLSSMPILQLLVPPLVAMSIPVVYSSIQFRKLSKLRFEICDIDDQIKDAICKEMDERINKSNEMEKDKEYISLEEKVNEEIDDLTSQDLEEKSHNNIVEIEESYPRYETYRTRYAYSSPLNYHSYRTERDETKKPGILYMDLEDDDEIEGPTLVKRK